MRRRIGFLLAILFGITVASPILHAKKPVSSPVSLSCSANTTGNINEMVPQGTAGPIKYVETIILGDVDVDVSGWQLCTSDSGKAPVCVSYGTGNMIVGVFDNASQTYDSGLTSHTPTQYLSSPQTLSSNEWEIALLDSAGDVMDYVHFCKDACKKDQYWSVPAACGVDLGGGGDNKIIFARKPDGEGDFTEVTDPTPGSSNDGEPDAEVDHYGISHSGSGVTCLAETVTITAHLDGDHNLASDTGEAQITLTTSHNRGDWISIVSGGGSLDNGAADDGEAIYTFASGEVSVQLAYSYTGLSAANETFSFNVTDGSATETSGSADASDDPPITFSRAELRFIDSLDNELIPTQISGKSSAQTPFAEALYLQAVQASDDDPTVCAALFTGDVTIELAAQCESPSSCVAGQLMNVVTDTDSENIELNSASPVSPGAYTPIELSFGADAKAPLSLTYSDAGQMQLHARYTAPDTAALISGSSNPFVVRPFAFGFTSVVADTVTNPGGDEVSGGGFTSAGSDFKLEINAFRYSAADDEDTLGVYDGVPEQGVNVTDNGVTPNFEGTTALSVDSFTPALGVEGDLTGDISLLLDGYSVRAGADTEGTLQYDEVGSLILIAQHSDYLGAVDADISGFSEKIGRFYPDHFELSAELLTLSCSSFNYMQQPYGPIEYRIEAHAADPAHSVTQNYDLALYTTDSVVLTAENADDGVDLSARLNTSASGSTISLSGWELGVINKVASAGGTPVTDVIFQRDGGEAGLEDGPFSQLQLGMMIEDGGLADGRNFESGALDIDPLTAGSCGSSCTAVAIGSIHPMRYGRLLLQSAHGPETQDLPVPFVTQYWDGSGFVTNSADSCTEIALADMSFDGSVIGTTTASRTVSVGDGSSVGTLTISGSSAVTNSGDFSLIFSAPGAGSGGNDHTGYFPVGISALDEWLRYDWDQNGTANDNTVPDAIITFGRARGNDRMIFWQENYQ